MDRVTTSPSWQPPGQIKASHANPRQNSNNTIRDTNAPRLPGTIGIATPSYANDH